MVWNFLRPGRFGLKISQAGTGRFGLEFSQAGPGRFWPEIFSGRAGPAWGFTTLQRTIHEVFVHIKTPVAVLLIKLFIEYQINYK